MIPDTDPVKLSEELDELFGILNEVMGDRLAARFRAAIALAEQLEESAEPAYWTDGRGRYLRAAEMKPSLVEAFPIPLYTHPAPKDASPAASGQGVEVEEIMEVVNEWMLRHYDTDVSEDSITGPDLRARLSSLGAGDRWIAVSERLPETKVVSHVCEQSDYVLVYAPKTGEHEFNVGKAYYLTSLDGNIKSGWRGDFGNRTTHWMPLPPSPLAARGEEVDGGDLGVPAPTSPSGSAPVPSSETSDNASRSASIPNASTRKPTAP